MRAELCGAIFFLVVYDVSVWRKVNPCVGSCILCEGFLLNHYLVMKKDGNNTIP